MTQDDAKRIEQAAIVMLHAVNSASGNAQVRAALKHLPPEGHVSLSTARELLEATIAWNRERRGRAINGPTT